MYIDEFLIKFQRNIRNFTLFHLYSGFRTEIIFAATSFTETKVVIPKTVINLRTLNMNFDRE